MLLSVQKHRRFLLTLVLASLVGEVASADCAEVGGVKIR